MRSRGVFLLVGLLTVVATLRVPTLRSALRRGVATRSDIWTLGVE